MKKRVLQALLIACFVISMMVCMTACNRSSDVQPEPQQTVSNEMTGSRFLATGFKEKSTVVPQKAKTLDEMTFELYVDGNGNGKGLMRYQNEIYDVIIVNDVLYVKVDEGLYARLSDLSGHLTPTSINVNSLTNLSESGFQLINGTVASLSYSSSDLSVRSMYQVSETAFEPANIQAGSYISTSEFAEYVASVKATAPVEPEQKVEEKESFYNQSSFGVTIDGVVYSIGDYCNVNTYFEGLTPQGIIPQIVKNGANNVQIDYATYIASDGHVCFKLINGYVWGISTDTNFNFIGIHKGDDEKELKAKLGFNLRREEEEKFKPIVEGLTATQSNNGFVLFLNGLTVNIDCDRRSGAVNSISIVQNTNFS